jgi:hypothetical protein
MDSSAREALDELVKSPGWLRFRQHVEQEWGTREHGGGAVFTNAARKAANQVDDGTALGHLRQICAAQKEIHTLMEWPETALKGLVKHEQEFAAIAVADYSRRGHL